MVWKPDYLTLVEGKNFVRVGDTVDDVEIAVIISAASRAIDKRCNRQFGKTAAAEERLYTPWYDSERGRWIVDTDDFQTAVGLVVTIGGVVTTEYVKEPVNAAQEGEPWTALSIPSTAAVQPDGGEYEAAITVVWGWTAFPSPVLMGARLQVSRFLARRDSPYGIAGSEAPLRLLSRLDADVAVSLSGLVRPGKVG